MKGKIARKADFIICFITDIVYFSVFSVSYCIFSYWANDGRFRIISLIGAAAGFFAYRLTVGKLIIKLSEKIIDIIYHIFYTIFSFTVLPVIRLIKKLCLLIRRKLFLPIISKIKLHITDKKKERKNGRKCYIDKNKSVCPHSSYNNNPRLSVYDNQASNSVQQFERNEKRTRKLGFKLQKRNRRAEIEN